MTGNGLNARIECHAMSEMQWKDIEGKDRIWSCVKRFREAPNGVLPLEASRIPLETICYIHQGHQVGTRVGSAFHFLLPYRSPLPDKSIHAAKAKRRTESQIHHVVQCDIGQQIPFGDDGSRRFVPDLERLLVERRTYPCFPCMNENTSPCSSTERTFAFKAFQVLN